MVIRKPTQGVICIGNNGENDVTLLPCHNFLGL